MLVCLVVWVVLGGGKGTYAGVDELMVAGVVIDVDCYAAEGGDFGGELVEAGVVLAFAFVGFGHFD